jgi:hypothetical protein
MSGDGILHCRQRVPPGPTRLRPTTPGVGTEFAGGHDSRIELRHRHR